MPATGPFYRRHPDLLTAAHIRSSVEYERQHMIPDPIGLRDIKESATADVMEAIARRAAELAAAPDLPARHRFRLGAMTALAGRG